MELDQTIGGTLSHVGEKFPPVNVLTDTRRHREVVPVPSRPGPFPRTTGPGVLVTSLYDVQTSQRPDGATVKAPLSGGRSSFPNT